MSNQESIVGQQLDTNSVKLVKAVYSFKASNNDELNFNKDDIIRLTQCVTGGWWEGTLNGVTAWFPSNYCQPVSDNLQVINSADHNLVNTEQLDQLLANNADIDTQQYRNMVFQDIEDTESAYVKDLVETINKYLKPLQQSQILPENEINPVLQIVQNIISVHRKFLSSLNNLKSVSYKDSRIGGIFLEFAPQIKEVHFSYCGQHSKFVHCIEKQKKEICSLFGSNLNDTNSGTVQLTTCLSSSFRRVDKYPALLQELQRYTDESHIDRGDTQRAGFVYRELSMSCLELRRCKEMELEVMLGNIKNWDPMPKIQSFGEIIRMDSVSIQIIPEYSEMKKDRYLVLFPKILLILSVSNEMTSFLYEAHIKLEDIVIKIADELVDKTNIFEINFTEDKTVANNNRSFIVQCLTIQDAKDWIQLLQKHINPQTVKLNTNYSRPNTGSESHRSTQPSITSDGSSGSNIVINTNPPRIGSIKSRYWSTRSLVPHPPSRISLLGCNSSKENQLSNNDDILILNVIESYCTRNAGKIRQQSNSAVNDWPQIRVLDEDKPYPYPDASVANNSVHSEEILNGSEISLREEIGLMKLEIKTLSDALRAEKRSRKKLKSYIIDRKNKKKQSNI